MYFSASKQHRHKTSTQPPHTTFKLPINANVYEPLKREWFH